MLPYEISAAEVAQLRTENKPVTLLDVRETWEVNTASIPGTLNIPMGEVPSRANNALDPESHIIVICHHGMRSLSVAAWLRREGFDNAQSLAGGIDQYSREIDHSIPLY
jgi:rhodanese-related sulfurtransferase